MIERAPLELETIFGFEPALLIDAGKRIPITSDGYVPLGLKGFKLKPQVPTIRDLGMGAVSLSLKQPFGFLDLDDDLSGRIRSQQTDGIVLAPSDTEPDKWQAILNTDMPLTPEDELLFNSGVRFYAFAAKRKFDFPPLPRSFWGKLSDRLLRK